MRKFPGGLGKAAGVATAVAAVAHWFGCFRERPAEEAAVQSG
jgi:hypothetical protein